MAGGAQKRAACLIPGTDRNRKSAMPTIYELARDFTALLRAGQFAAAGEQFWARDVISIEPTDQPDGVGTTVSGFVAVRNRCAARFGASCIDEIGIDGPFITGDQFALFLDLVLVDPASGVRQPLSEIATYTVRDGQIAEERYFYA